jgi:hypothetical protein
MNPETESFNCYKCEDVFHTDEAHHLEEGDYCMDCYTDVFRVCDYCKEAIKKEKIYTIEGEDYKEEEGDYCFDCAYDTLQSKLSSSFQGVDIEKVFIFYRKFIKEAQEAKEKESKMFHERWFEVRGENVRAVFETYAEANELFNELIAKGENNILNIFEVPAYYEEDWKEMFKHHEYPADKILKSYNKETYCGEPGSMNYLLQIPLSKVHLQN